MGLKGKKDRKGKLGDSGEAAPEVEFGKTYRDRITGFVGIATAFTSFISGCDQVLLAPRVGKDGKKDEGHWFDDVRLIDDESGRAAEVTSGRGADADAPAPIK